MHRLEWFIALRDLLSTRKNTFLSIISLLSVLGVATGVGFLMMVISVMAGFEKDFLHQILGLDAHVEVRGVKGFSRPEEWIREIKKSPEVLEAAAFVEGEVLLSGGGQTRGATVRGIDPNGHVTDFATTLEGSCRNRPLKDCLVTNRNPAVILGGELAQDLKIFFDSSRKVEMISPFGEMGPLGYEPYFASFEATGTFRSGFYEYDTQRAYVSLSAAQEFFQTHGRVSGIEVKVTDIYAVQSIGEQLSKSLLELESRKPQHERETFVIRDWQQQNQKLFSALELEKIVMFVVLMLIVVVASFLIFVTLTMLVLEKRSQVAILRTLGLSQAQIRRVFLLAGGVIGISGAGLGFLGGLLLCTLLKRYHFVELPPQYYVTTIPVELRWPEISLIVICAIAISILAAILPAHRASKTHPVEILRHEV